jgi:hypothetical protein
MPTYQQNLFDQPIQNHHRPTHAGREKIKAGILEILQHEGPMKAKQIAYRLSRTLGVTVYRHDVNSLIYGELRRIVIVQKPNFIVALVTEGTMIPPKPRARRPATLPTVTSKPILNPVIYTGTAILPKDTWNPRRLIGRAIGFGYAFLAFELIKFVLSHN